VFSSWPRDWSAQTSGWDSRASTSEASLRFLSRSKVLLRAGQPFRELLDGLAVVAHDSAMVDDPTARIRGSGSVSIVVWLGSVGARVDAMIRVGSIVLRVDDLLRQTEFWAAALDYVPREDQSDDFMLLRPRDGVGPNLSLDMVPSTVQVPPRIHLDLYTEDQAGEVDRLIALGATEVHWDKRPPDADYVILADPEGNRFCVVDIS
jgi:hypothetical protein